MIRLESNSWPAARATTRKSIDYGDNPDNGLDHHQEPHQERRQDNEIDERSELNSDDEEDGSLNPSLPAGTKDTLYQLTTERSSWRGRNTANNRPVVHLMLLVVSILVILF